MTKLKEVEFDHYYPFTKALKTAIENDGIALVKHRWVPHYNDGKQAKELPAAKRLQTIFESSMVCAHPFADMVNIADIKRMDANIQSVGLDEQGYERFHLQFNVASYLGLPNEKPVQELKELLKFFEIIEANYKEEKEEPFFKILNHGRKGEFIQAGKDEDLKSPIFQKLLQTINDSPTLSQWVVVRSMKPS